MSAHRDAWKRAITADRPARSIEQPPCRNCGHRRIYHYIIVSTNDEARPCTMPGAASILPCGCKEYQPKG